MFKIGDLAKIFNISVKTIRFYEEEKLLLPSFVDRWTGYRYYDENSIKKLSEILYLKSLGFSLQEIKSLDEETLHNKTSNLQKDIEKIYKNIKQINSIHKNQNGGFVMNSFINDKKAIGKWQKVALVNNIKDYSINSKNNEEIFPFSELYLLPQGEEYWVVSWTKGSIIIKGVENPYEIHEDAMFIGIRDRNNGSISEYAVYKKIDSKEYSLKDIKIEDNVNIPFIKDEKAVGFWQTIDLVEKIEDFNPMIKFWKSEIIVNSYLLLPDGKALLTFNNQNTINIKWTNAFILNAYVMTASEYIIKEIDGESYMIVEWKSGDYSFGGKVNVYIALKKMKI